MNRARDFPLLPCKNEIDDFVIAYDKKTINKLSKT